MTGDRKTADRWIEQLAEVPVFRILLVGTVT